MFKILVKRNTWQSTKYSIYKDAAFLFYLILPVYVDLDILK